ncbi:DNA-protecting protein DprA [Staphylococcus muscae]|uniref:DNA processing protein DprA n=1 Tax=Staphylococcus muscae TaxID=1294 RepID=A0A240C3I9_9STAP|nr:DNA-processing protein DprA [Staphylococcus muscae]AVQ32863.1 DNA-protecting protein DprA [Staphylococcus muscae]PNZ06693.1 DNA-protecting protein DprA [Staphylococcus muscae]GGA80590.1 DNA processing protein DprA [Staphylococcus muscae]SNW01883.1 DprA SMF protein putative DNA processing factor [Staphylococcus muscae]
MTDKLTIEQLLLLLVYSGFSTRQIHKFFPNIERVNGNQSTLIEILESHQDKRIQRKINKLRHMNIQLIEQHLQDECIHTVSLYAANYPTLLKHIYDPPTILFCRGQLQLLTYNQTLAIVGSRNHTHYTNKVLNDIMPHFASAQLEIVSGLAKGADACAHQLAIRYGCPTIAVLGFGHQHHYPKETKYLRNYMDRAQLTISEYPPFVPPAAYRFPERNRLISGLSKGVFITEAKERSGALITIDHALEQNRNVYVLPGDMYNPFTKGNLLRIQEGAEVVLSENDILKDYCQ